MAHISSAGYLSSSRDVNGDMGVLFNLLERCSQGNMHNSSNKVHKLNFKNIIPAREWSRGAVSKYLLGYERE